ncbi:MAG: TolC family protein [Rikenellaceae bacterium]
MNIKTKLLLCGLFLLCASTSKAQIVLDINKAVEIALSDNPTIKIADKEVERYDYVRKETMGALLPSVSVSSEYGRTLKSSSLAKGFSLGKSQYDTYTTTGTVTLALYSPSTYRTLHMNSAQREAAIESARSSRLTLTARVKESFYAVLLAQHSLIVLESSLQNAKQTVFETQTKFDNGLVAEYDLLTAQVQQSNLEPSVIEARSSITIAKEVLKMYLSIPQNVSIELKGELHKLKLDIVESFTSLSHDLSNNSTLKSLELESVVLEQSLRVSNSSRLPSLSAYGTISYTGNNMGSFSLSSTESDTSSSDDSFFWQSPSSAGIQLTIPLFSGLSNTYRSRQITNQIAQLELQRQNAQREVEVGLSEAINKLITSREQMFAQETTVQQASRAYSIAQTRYSAGAGTILELNTSQLALTQAELNLSQAIYNLLVARSEYDEIIGKEN